MRCTRPLIAALLLCLELAVPGNAIGGDFEGAIKARHIYIAINQLSSLLKGNPADARNIFALPIEQLLTLKDSIWLREPTFYFRGSKMRLEVGGPVCFQTEACDPQGYAITDLAQGTSWQVMPTQKKYIERTNADVGEVGDKADQKRRQVYNQFASVPPEQRKQLARPLGKMQTVNGMSATGYEVLIEGSTALGWVTQEHRNLISIFKSMQESQKNTIPVLLAEHGLPVLVQEVNGGRYHVEEITAIEERLLPADMFSLPADFERITPKQVMGR
jgi:hypothetical protein